MAIVHYNPPMLPGQPGHMPGAREESLECDARAPPMNPPYACTREAGHDGPHAAHGTHDELYATWTDTDKEAPNA